MSLPHRSLQSLNQISSTELNMTLVTRRLNPNKAAFFFSASMKVVED